MGRTIAIANQKGGVGKTTTAVNVAAYLAERNRRVLLVDIDPQGNATTGLGVERGELETSIYDVLVEGVPAVDAVRPTRVEGLHVIGATADLAGAEIELVSRDGREHILKEALAGLVERYDYIWIDCPPSLGLMTLNALVAADGVFIPVQCEYYALEGLSQLMRTIGKVQASLNMGLQLDGIVLTMFDARTNLAIQVVDEVKKHFRGHVLSTIVPRNVRLSEAPSHGRPISRYDPRSRGAEVYRQLAEEILERREGRAEHETGSR